MLSRKTSTPASTRPRIESSDREAGPIVATIFVRTMRGAVAGAGMVRVLLVEGGRRGGMRTRRIGECILKPRNSREELAGEE